jgi:outer membrane protein assembly factor BamB
MGCRRPGLVADTPNLSTTCPLSHCGYPERSLSHVVVCNRDWKEEPVMTRIAMRLRVAVLIWVLALATSVVPAAAADDATAPEDWSQWRGPRRDGSVQGPEWPEDLSGLRPTWRVELGKGYPGPIVAGDRVFVVESSDSKTVGVRALAREDGSELWRRTWPGKGSVPFFAARNGAWVRSTPAFAGRLLYVGDMQEVLTALKADSGEIAWRVDFPARFETEVPDFGFASSPLVDGEHLYVQAANSIVKLNRRTGETVWRSLAGTGKINESGAFSSPVIAELAGLRQLLVQKRHLLHGVALDDGRELWSQAIENFRGMMILTPTVYADAVFTSTYKGRTYLFTVKREGETFAVEETWSNKASGYMSSPVVIDGHAYLHLGNRRVDCIDLATGESRWRSERSFAKYWSMVAQGDKILSLGSEGDLHLLRANTERLELLDSRRVADDSWAHLAVSGNELFVRELKAIAAYRWSVPTVPSSR